MSRGRPSTSLPASARRSGGSHPALPALGWWVGWRRQGGAPGRARASAPRRIRKKTETPHPWRVQRSPHVSLARSPSPMRQPRRGRDTSTGQMHGQVWAGRRVARRRAGHATGDTSLDRARDTRLPLSLFSPPPKPHLRVGLGRRGAGRGGAASARVRHDWGRRVGGGEGKRAGGKWAHAEKASVNKERLSHTPPLFFSTSPPLAPRRKRTHARVSLSHTHTFSLSHTHIRVSIAPLSLLLPPALMQKKKSKKGQHTHTLASSSSSSHPLTGRFTPAGTPAAASTAVGRHRQYQPRPPPPSPPPPPPR